MNKEQFISKCDKLLNSIRKKGIEVNFEVYESDTRFGKEFDAVAIYKDYFIKIRKFSYLPVVDKFIENYMSITQSEFAVINNLIEKGID